MHGRVPHMGACLSVLSFRAFSGPHLEHGRKRRPFPFLPCKHKSRGLMGGSEMPIVTIDGKHYRMHAEVLNKLFGKKFKCYQKAECKLKNGYSVWFPVVTRTTNPVLAKTAYNGWRNLLVNGDTEIQQYWPDPSKAPIQRVAAEKRITFAKFFSGNAYWYEFIGVFEKVGNAPDHTTYKRIAVRYP